MKLIIAKDYDDLSIKTAKIIAQLIKDKPNLLFCLPAGSSPLGMYENLIEMYRKREISFKQMTTFNMDEYVGLTKNHHQSYAYFTNKHFLQYIDVKENNIYRPNGLANDLSEMAINYSKLMQTLGGIDIAITGIGDNGHIAFNEPNETLQLNTHIVNLATSTIQANSRFFADISEVPSQAISIGMQDIFNCRTFIVVASGIKKAPMLKKFFDSSVLDPKFPVSFLHLHPNCLFIVDQEAISLCNQTIIQDNINY